MTTNISFNSYLIDFTMGVNADSSGNLKSKVTLITQASPPTKSSLKSSITDLITYLSVNSVNISNYTMVSNSVKSIVSEASSSLTSTTELTSLITNINSSISDSTTLYTNLNNLLTYINQNSTETTTFTSPESDTQTASGATTTGSLRSKIDGTTVTTTRFKGLGKKVASIQSDAISSANVNNNAISIFKRGFSIFSNRSSILTTGTNNNNLANVVSNLLNGNARMNRNRRQNNNSVTGSRSEILKSVHDFSSLNPTTNNTVSLTESTISDTYEVFTNSPGNGLLEVTFAYFKAGSTTSSFSCKYNLTPASLFSVSESAFKKVVKLSLIEKSNILQSSGYTLTTSPSDTDVWNAYLIWVFSFISFGVASYLGADINLPYSGSVDGSANYMLSGEYIENIGNLALPIILHSRDSHISALFSVGIANKWSDYMYNDSSTSSKSYGSVKAIAESLISTLQKTTSTS